MPTDHSISRQPVTPQFHNVWIDNIIVRERPPVFVHSSYRTGSTWLWSKFRNAPTTLAYYEIFHEKYSNIDMTAAISDGYSTWESKHPPAAPYFFEFIPLRKVPAGIHGYDHRMAFDYFLPINGIRANLSAVEMRYIDQLIQNARNHKKIPVLTDVRTLGRVNAIARAFPSKSIFLHRNLFHQWASYSQLALNGNPYFLNTVQKILSASRHDSFLCAVDDWFSSREASPYNEKFFQVYLILHLYLYAFAHDAADVVIDINRISWDAERRRDIESEISGWICWPIDLSDARSEFGVSVLDVRLTNAFVDSIDQFTKLIVGLAPSPASALFVENVKNSALLEWERHEFFAKNLRSVLAARIRDGEQSVAQIRAESNLAVAERDRLRVDLCNANSTHVNLDNSIAEITAERDSLNRELTEAISSQEQTQRALAAVCAELDGFRAQLIDANGMREQFERLVATITAERDALSAELAESIVAQERARKDVAAIEAERDGAQAQLAEANTARELLERTVISANAERDALIGSLAKVSATRDHMQKEVAAIGNERDILRALFTEAITARDRLQEIVAELGATCDKLRKQLNKITLIFVDDRVLQRNSAPPHLYFGIAGYRDADGSVISRSKVAGCVFFGPYIDLPSGDYKVRFQLLVDLSIGPRTITLDVSDGDHCYASASVLLDRRVIQTELSFKVPPTSKSPEEKSRKCAIETRIYSNDGALFRLADFKIVRREGFTRECTILSRA